VIYCDILKRQIKPVHQKYTCLSNTKYRYENVPNDFEVTIEVDESGLVVDYPSLFLRTTTLETNTANIASFAVARLDVKHSAANHLSTLVPIGITLLDIRTYLQQFFN
jgi:hypothetical protein